MKRERLASMWEHALAFDLETALIQPGLPAPPPVLGSAAEIVNGQIQGFLLDKRQCRELFRKMLDTRQTIICGANIAFDFLVEAVDFATTLGQDIMPELFNLYDPEQTIIRGHCDGRVFEVLLAEPLHAIAQGHHGKSAATHKQFINKKTGRAGRYSLDVVTAEVTGREDAKDNDRFRLDYWMFNDVPLDKLPYEAAKYPVDDAKNTLECALGQAGWIPAINVHLWHDTDGMVLCRACGRSANDDTTPKMCLRQEPRRNLHDLARQAYAAWALHVGAAWGFEVDQDKVDALEKKILDRREIENVPFLEAGILRPDGSEDQAVLKRLVAHAYGARATCTTCLNRTLTNGKLCKPGKIPSEKTLGKTEVNCPDCDGTAIHLTPDVPRSKGGGISKDRDTLQESGDELLMAYGEQEGEKILTTYIPLMRGGRACNACGRSGAGKKPHADWCPDGENATYRKIALTLSPNALVDTGRCSYEKGVHGLPRKGGVRNCFVARKGYLLSSEDYQAGELVTHADNCIELVGYSKLADALNGGLDAHLALAGTMLGKSYQEMEALLAAKNPIAKDNRQAAKAANFGFGGGMAELTFVLRKRSDPDLFTPCANGPDEDKGIRGYKGMRPCILMDGHDRCGYVKVTSYNDKPTPPVCLNCLKAAKRLREFWFDQWPENNNKNGYFAIIKKMLANPGPSGDAEITHLGSMRVRGGVGFCDGANGLFQGKLGDAAKNAFCQIQRECLDRTIRVRSSEMMTSRYDGGESPLYGSRAIMLAHDETVAEHPESVASDAAIRVSEIMVEALRFMCPRMFKAVKAEPTLMRFLAKDAVPVWADKEKTKLLPWEPS